MRINVLGPIEVLGDDGNALTLGTPKERALLTWLALSPGRVIGSGTLIDGLWGDHAPDTAMKTTQTYVFRLRRAIGSSSIDRAGSGYQLAVEADDVDVHQFESLRRKGSERLKAGNAEDAVGLLEAAVALWRGDPATDIAGTPRGDAARRQLIEAHADLLDDLTDARLALGGSGELVASLEMMLSDDPFRERRWGQLMLALYRSGRQADALAAFQRARTTLADELGLEPGVDLRDLEQRIIEQHPDLSLPKEVTTRTPLAKISFGAGEGDSLPVGVVTFLLTDIEGSTVQWDQAPSTMAAALSRHDELVGKIVADHGGVLVKSRGEGDATFNVFSRCIDAAGAAIDLMETFGKEKWPTPKPLRLRASITTGEAELRDGDYFGITVNRAARIRGLAAGFEVLVSNTSYEIIADARLDDFRLEDRGERQLRGISRPERIWALEAVDAFALGDENGGSAGDDSEFDPSAMSDLSWTDSNRSMLFVGRAAEYDAMLAAWHAVREDPQRGLVLLDGEPGIGKTRLAGEFAKVASQEGGLVLYGRSDDGIQAAYQPFTEALSRYVRSCPLDVLRSQVGGSGAFLSRVIPSLADRLGDVGPTPTIDPESAQHQVFEAISDFLDVICAQAPVVLVLDDLHWATQPTVQLLWHLLRRPSSQSLLIVATYRGHDLTGDSPMALLMGELHRTERVRTISMSGLDRDAVFEFMAATAGHDLDEEILELATVIYQETGGNPFFLATLLAHLAESGVIVRLDERWRVAGDVSAAGLPDGVRQVVDLRLRQLSHDAQECLKAASIIGTSFDLAVLGTLSGSDSSDLMDRMEEAAANGIVREDPRRFGSYRFAHDLVRQTLLQRISTARRVQSHWIVATAMADAGGDLDEIAHHASEGFLAGDPVRAGRLMCDAAANAVDRLGYDSAVVHATNGLSAIEGVDAPRELRCDLLTVRAVALFNTGLELDDEDLIGACAAAEAEAILSGDPDRMARALTLDHTLFPMYFVGHFDERRLASVEKALASIRGTAPDSEALLLAFGGALLCYHPDILRRAALAQEALDRLTNDTPDAIRTRVLGHALKSFTDYTNWKKAVPIAAELIATGDAQGMSDGFAAHTFLALLNGQFDVATTNAAYLTDAGRSLTAGGVSMVSLVMVETALASTFADLEKAKRILDNPVTPSSPLLRDFAIMGRGNAAAAHSIWTGIDCGAADLILGMRSMSRSALPAATAAVAVAELFAGRTAEAEGLWRRVKDEAPQRFRSSWGSAGMACAASKLAIRFGAGAAASDFYCEVAPASGLFACAGGVCLGPVDWYLGDLSLHLSDLDGAARELSRARQQCEERGMDAWGARVALSQAELARIRGDRTTAESLIAHALDVGRRMNLQALVNEAEAAI